MKLRMTALILIFESHTSLQAERTYTIEQFVKKHASQGVEDWFYEYLLENKK